MIATEIEVEDRTVTIETDDDGATEIYDEHENMLWFEDVTELGKFIHTLQEHHGKAHVRHR